MDSLKKKGTKNVKTHFLSPFRKIFKPKIEDLSNQPVKNSLITSYLRYKKHPLSGNISQNLKIFWNSLNGKDKTSSLLITMKNFMDQKKYNIRSYPVIKRFYKKINYNKNNLRKIKNMPRSLSESEKYSKKYKYLMENLSFNGNNTYASFKNISNNALDNIFKQKPFISFDATNIKIVNKAPLGFNYFHKNTKNKNKEINYSKENDLTIQSRNSNNKNNFLNGDKKISFENKVLNNLNERKEFDSLYSEREYKKIQSKYLESSKIIDNSKPKRNIEKTEFYKEFKILKQKLQKQNEVSDKIKKDINRQLSLNKHEIQVGIVKLNEYKVKMRQFKKMHGQQ